MRILLDADVLLDLALDRKPFAEAAAALLGALQARHAHGWLAWHTVSNFYYLAAPHRGRAEAKAFVLELLRFVNVAPASAASVRYAASIAMPDFEDALQVAAAAACGADYIATRNLRDFARSPIPALLPVDLLEQMA